MQNSTQWSRMSISQGFTYLIMVRDSPKQKRRHLLVSYVIAVGSFWQHCWWWILSSLPCVISSFQVWAGPSDLLLMSGIQQNAPGMLHPRLGNKRLWLLPCLPVLMEAVRGFHGKHGKRPPASRQQGAEALHATNHEKLNPPATTWAFLGVEPSSPALSGLQPRPAPDCSLGRNCSTQVGHPWVPDPQKTWDKKWLF